MRARTFVTFRGAEAFRETQRVWRSKSHDGKRSTVRRERVSVEGQLLSADWLRLPTNACRLSRYLLLQPVANATTLPPSSSSSSTSCHPFAVSQTHAKRRRRRRKPTVSERGGVGRSARRVPRARAPSPHVARGCATSDQRARSRVPAAHGTATAESAR